jgi:hypothetical protein
VQYLWFCKHESTGTCKWCLLCPLTCFHQSCNLSCVSNNRVFFKFRPMTIQYQVRLLCTQYKKRMHCGQISFVYLLLYFMRTVACPVECSYFVRQHNNFHNNLTLILAFVYLYVETLHVSSAEEQFHDGSIGLWRRYNNMTITILDFIHCPVFYLKLEDSETGFCLRLQVEPTQMGSVSVNRNCWAYLSWFYLKTEKY